MCWFLATIAAQLQGWQRQSSVKFSSHSHSPQKESHYAKYTQNPEVHNCPYISNYDLIYDEIWTGLIQTEHWKINPDIPCNRNNIWIAVVFA